MPLRNRKSSHRSGSGLRKAFSAVPGACDSRLIEDAKLRAQVQSIQRQISFQKPADWNPPLPLATVLNDWYKKNVEKPGKILSGFTELWMQLVPSELCSQTRLVSVSRGVLHVLATNSVVAAELNIHLRQGLSDKLQNLSKGAIFRVKITVDRHLAAQE